ncbi:hypothetical protein B0H17DRAFT_1215228 [Mycena rosella]|uniref:Uncharacterized protein n=1 Tax=Mycena rosella TaxID=1033263 RepID=A0AAD7CLC3_MYCRO|nr:hypothetical protein B0H17DRAFT_1215228 [Mycena rosella]
MYTDAAGYSFPRKKVFPLLSSIELNISDSCCEIEIPEFLESFARAPALRCVDIRADCDNDLIVFAVFLWAQLTDLTLTLSITTHVARDLLVQCAALESVTLHGLRSSDDSALLPEHITLHHLQTLDIMLASGGGEPVLLDAVSLSQLQSLALCQDFPDVSPTDGTAATLLTLHGRAPFTLEYLSLVRIDVEPDELFALLCILPELKALEIIGTPRVGNRLLAMLTHGRPPSMRGLRLLHLRTLMIGPIHMVESLATHAGGVEAPFPTLHRLCLYRAAHYLAFVPLERSPEVLGRCLASACSTGFLVDRFLRRNS